MMRLLFLLAGLLMGLASFGQVASTTQYGVVKVGSGLSVSDGVLNATGGGGSSMAYQKITTTSTIAPTAAITTIAVDNGSANVAVNLDPASTVGAVVFVKRYDNNSSGALQINATGTALMQNTSGLFGDGILMPTGATARNWGFVWNGTHYELISQ